MRARENMHRAIDPKAASVAMRPIQDAGFDLSPVAQVVIDHAGTVVLANIEARALLRIGPEDVGRPFQDLELSGRPAELRSPIEQALSERRSIALPDVVWNGDEEERHYDVHVTPLAGVDGDAIGVAIAWTDVSGYQTLRAELEQTKRDLETAYAELQSAVEELATTNEELRSTNRELETMNEELETMNDELRSTNEELETMNEELRERTDEALQANTFLSSILSSIAQSVIVLDQEIRVTAWSDAASDLWGLRADEVENQLFLNLDIGLPLGDLRTPIRAAIAGNSVPDVVVEADDRRGRPTTCRIAFSHLSGPRGEGIGAILVMSAEPRSAEKPPIAERKGP